MYKICVLVDKFYKFGGGEIFLEDLMNNSAGFLDFKYLISLEKPQAVYHDPMLFSIKHIDFNEDNIKKVCLECDVLLFWGKVLDSVGDFSIKKVMWAHSDYNVNFYLEKAEKHADHYVACSTSVKKAINKKNSTVIVPGIDSKRYVESGLTKKQIRSFLGFRDEDFVIGHFSSFGKVKNIPFLIEAVSDIKDSNVKILLIGHGPELSNIIDLCEKKIPKRFQHLYYVDSKNLSSFFKCLDAFCLPSHGEGYARVQWECALFKVPFIGTNVGGVGDGIIDGTNGFIIKEKEELNNIIKKLKKEDAYNKIVSNAYDLFCSKGEVKNTILDIKKLFDKLLLNKKIHM